MQETPVRNQLPEQQQTSDTSADPGDIHLLDLVVILAKHKKVVLGLPIVAAILAVIYGLIASPVYTATTKIMPPQNQSTSASLLAQIGGLAALAPGGAGIRTPTDVYVAMLKSRTVADRLIDRFGLMELFNARYRSNARKMLEGITTIVTAKDGLITINIDDQDPKRAAAIANAYVEEVLKLMNVLAVTEASQRRLFFERQFALARDNLAQAEAAARQALQRGGLVQVEGQSRAMIETTARLRGQIAVKQVQISAMQSFATDRNPELLAAQKERDALKLELAKLEGTTTQTGPDNAMADSRGIESVRLLRNVKYYETMYELLAKQYELARLDEAKDSGLLQVLDPAIEPDSKSKPKRRQIVMVWTIVGLFVGVFWAFVAEMLTKVTADPRQGERLREIRRYMAWRRS